MFEDYKYRKILDITAIIVIVLLVVQIFNMKSEAPISTFKAQKKTQKTRNLLSQNYANYLETIFSEKWSKASINGNQTEFLYMVEITSDGKLKSINDLKLNPNNVQANNIVEQMIKEAFPLKPLPRQMKKDEVAFNIEYTANGGLQIHLFHKVKASEEQLNHQKRLNEWRNANKLPSLPLREYTYVSYNYIPRSEKPASSKSQNINFLKLEKKVAKKQNVTSTSRPITGDELNRSRISSAYSNYMEYCLRSNWKNPTGNNKYSASFTFNIDRDGRLTAYDVLKSSESDEYDKAAIQCLLDTAPFKPIPKELQMDGLNAQLYFNGLEVQVNVLSKINPTRMMVYKVNQANKNCNTVEIAQAKRLSTQSMYNASVPHSMTWDISKHVQHNWAPPLDENSSVCLTFRINKLGLVQNIRFEKKSYNEAADMAAYNAVKDIKLTKMLSDFKNLFIDVKYWFYVSDNKVN